MAELRTAVGTLISKQRELSSSYASPISAARSAPRSRPASSARIGAGGRFDLGGPGIGTEPAQRRVGHLVQARVLPSAAGTPRP